MTSRPERQRATLKTYSHLASARRIPSEYELVTTSLLYYVPRGGFEVTTPISAWYARYQRGSAWSSADWERFEDPRATTYTSYVAAQRTREAFAAGLLESIETSDYDASLPPAWLATLDRTLFAMRYAWHGLQMAAAYVGQMAPAGRVAIAALFQCADEVRRIQLVAYRLGLLERTGAGAAAASKEAWMRDAPWQPTREAIERLLVTYDWAEAFVALNLCVKPALDGALGSLSRAASDAGDYLLVELLRSLEADAEWQRSWTSALVSVASAGPPEHVAALSRWVADWKPRADAAAAALTRSFGSTEHAEVVR